MLTRSRFITSLIILWLLAGCGSEEITPPTAQPATSSANPTSIPSTIPATATAEPTITPSTPPTSDLVAGQGNADVVHIRAVQADDGSWTFYVTVSHPDIGWEDYADGWDVVTPDGTVIKRYPDDPFTRLLLHPHVDEQPFTRSQGNLIFPAGVTFVTVRAHDLVDGFGGQEVVVDLTVESGENFEVEK